MDAAARIEMLEHAAAELLESEDNGSLTIGVAECDCDPLVVTALGCSVLLTVGSRASNLIAMAALREGGGGGPRALAAGCDRTLRALHGLPHWFVPSLRFDNPGNAAGFLRRLR